MADTQIFTPPSGDDSKAFGISMRGWLAAILVITVCASHLMTAMGALYDAIVSKSYDRLASLVTVGEPLYSMSVAALGFYFGTQKNKQ